MQNSLMDEQSRKKLAEIYTYYRKDLFITAYSILRDYHEAEDAVQTAILKISTNLEKINEIKCKKTRSFLVIIVRNVCYDLYNMKKNLEYLPDHEIPGREDKLDIEEYILKIEESGEIARDLDKLHQPYADILTLRYYYELSIAEIAGILSITEENVSVRLHRALKAMKGILDERGDKLDKSVK